MSIVLDAQAVIARALEGVSGLRVVTGLGQALIPPVAVVGPPTLTWEGYGREHPTSGAWPVYLVASLTEFATATLLDLIDIVALAIDKETAGIVRSATPSLYPSGDQGDLPCYLIEVEMELS